MIAARAHMRLKQPSEALVLFREVERLVKPETDLAFQASYYRLLCFFQIEGRHVPDQVDAFLQLYRKSRPEDPRIHTALMMKAETLFSNKETADAAKVYSEINATVVSEKNRPGLLYQRGWCLVRSGRPPGRHPLAHRVHHPLSRGLRAFPPPSPNAPRPMSRARSRRKPSPISTASPPPGTPDDLASFAWLESARMRRGESNIPDMIVRYQGLLKNVGNLSENLQAEANYWIGWGLVKTNAAKEAIAYLEKARTLRPDAYRKHAGMLLALGYFASQDAAKLAAEIKLAIDGKYESDIPDQVAPVVRHAILQLRRLRLRRQVPRTHRHPGRTPRHPQGSLALPCQGPPRNRRRRGRARRRLQRARRRGQPGLEGRWPARPRPRAARCSTAPTEARKAADEALALHPQGRTSGGLRILIGDLEMKANDPQKASAEYLIVVGFLDDKELKPLALSKLDQSPRTTGRQAPRPKNTAASSSPNFPSGKRRERVF